MGELTHTCALCNEDVTVEFVPLEGADNLGLNAALERLAKSLVHDACLNEYLNTRKQQEKFSRAKWVRRSCVEQGWIPYDSIDCNLKRSQSAIESRNGDYSRAYKWIREWTPGILQYCAWIQGPPGTGKTYAARCLYNRIINMTGQTAYEVQAQHFHQWAIAFIGNQKRFGDLAHAGVLLIDDIHVPEWRKESVSTLRDILDKRTRAHLPTIITSNLAPEPMRSIWKKACGYNDAIVDSMFDRMRVFHRITLDGTTLRQLEIPRKDD